MSAAPLLQVRDLVHEFALRSALAWRARARVRAVDGVSFQLERGETLALVGETGCGKSTTARAILRLFEPTSGEVLFAPDPDRPPRDVLQLERGALRRLRPRMQMVFQDPYASLNPRLTVRQAIGEVLRFHRIVSAAGLDAHLVGLLEQVGLDADALQRFPHEFSGGQRQRIGIARALAPRPALLVADEPTSALDVSIQAQVLNLLQRLKRELGLSYLFISHDLSVVRHMADRVAVMYLGRIVESGSVQDVFERPAHPYTQALFAAAPQLGSRGADHTALAGEVPSATNLPRGCRFRTRCPLAEERCGATDPRLHELAPGHEAACLLLESPSP